MNRRLALLLLAYLLLTGAVSLRRHWGLNSTTFDLAVHQEILTRLSQGQEPFLLTRGLNATGDHYAPLGYLLVPVFWLWGSPEMLLLLQSALLALGAIPVFRMARRSLGSADCGLLFAALYLCQPILHECNRFDFHFGCFFAPLLLWVLDSLEEGNWRLYLAGLLLVAGTTGEAAGFSILALSYSAWRVRGWRWGALTALLAGAALALATLTMQQASQGLPSQYYSLYAAHGGKGIVAWLLTAPQEWLPLLLEPRYLGLLMLPLGGLSVLAPGRLIPALPVLLGNLLSWRPSQHGIEYHYCAAVLPFLVWAAIDGAVRLKSWLEARGEPPLLALSWLAGLGALIGLWVGPLNPWSDELPRPGASRLRAEIPVGASVSAPNTGGPQLPGRQVYLFPNPFQQSAWGHRPQALAEQTEHGVHPMLPGEARRSLDEAKLDYVVFMPQGMSFPLIWQDVSLYLDSFLRNRHYGVLEAGEELIVLARDRGQRSERWPAGKWRRNGRSSSWPAPLR